MCIYTVVFLYYLLHVNSLKGTYDHNVYSHNRAMEKEKNHKVSWGTMQNAKLSEKTYPKYDIIHYD